MKIKFCGLFRGQDIEYANALMPDFIGFVFVPNSKRFVDFRVAKGLKANLDSRIQAVGVFVDSPMEVVVNAVREGIIDIVQLHGSEDNTYISALRESLRKLQGKTMVGSFVAKNIVAGNPAQNMQKDCGTIAPIIKAVKMRDSHSLDEALESKADFILLDSANAGSGVAFEWGILAQKLQDSQDFKRDFSERFFLAGGINADNLPKAIALNPYCIDISSGIESQGIKNFAKMQKIIETIRTNK